MHEQMRMAGSGIPRTVREAHPVDPVPQGEFGEPPVQETPAEPVIEVAKLRLDQLIAQARHVAGIDNQVELPVRPPKYALNIVLRNEDSGPTS